MFVFVDNFQTLILFSCPIIRQADKKAWVLPVLVSRNSNHTSPGCVQEPWPQHNPLNHDKSQASILSKLSEAILDLLGRLPCSPQKASSCESCIFPVPSVYIWYYQSWHLNQILSKVHSISMEWPIHGHPLSMNDHSTHTKTPKTSTNSAIHNQLKGVRVRDASHRAHTLGPAGEGATSFPSW